MGSAGTMLLLLAIGALGLDAGQLQAWQAFYDGVNGMSSCSKCSNRNDPCSCGWGSNWYGPGVLCEGDSITKISLYSCSLSGESRLLLSFSLSFFYMVLTRSNFLSYCVILSKMIFVNFCSHMLDDWSHFSFL